MKTIAFIFARGGSKRLKNKNLRIINGKPLIYYSIKIAQEIKKIEDIYVSSDNKKILDYALSLGAKIIKRPKYLSTSKADEIMAWKHAVNFVLKKGIAFDYFLSLPTTSPLRIKRDIYRVFKSLKINTDIVLTATDTHRNPWKNMLILNDKKPQIINKIKNPTMIPKVYDLTMIAYLATTKYVLNCKNLLDGNVELCFIPRNRSIDIDDSYDLSLAEILMKKKYER